MEHMSKAVCKVLNILHGYIIATNIALFDVFPQTVCLILLLQMRLNIFRKLF